MMDSPVTRVLDALIRYGSRVRAQFDGTHMAQCPAHDDHNPSLHVSVGRDDNAIVHCLAGCQTSDVLAKLGLKEADLFTPRAGETTATGPGPLRPLSTVIGTTMPVAQYTYLDDNGEPVLKVVRLAMVDVSGRTVGKSFRQYRRHGNGWLTGLGELEPPLYHLPEVRQAADAGGMVWIVEGEKDADTLTAMGLTATTNPMGAGKWRPLHTEACRGAHVVVLADDDAPGRAHGLTVSQALQGVARSVLTALPASGHKDVSEQLGAGVPLSALRWVPFAAEPVDVNGKPSVRLTSAASIVIAPVRWTWLDRLPRGSLSLLAGRAGVGKSCVLMWLIAQLTRGLLPGWYQGEPRDVLYAAAEDSWPHTVVPRLVAAGADLERVYRVDVVEHDMVRGLILPSDCEQLRTEISDRGAAMLALDPITSTIDPNLNTHNNRELRRALEPIADLADDTQCAVIANAHLNKSSGTDALSLVTGSAAYVEVARAALGAIRDPDGDGYVLSQLKNNLGRLNLPDLTYEIRSIDVDTPEGPADVGAVSWGEVTPGRFSDIMRDSGNDGDDRIERNQAAEWLIGFLTDQGGEALAADVQRSGHAVGFSGRSLQRARAKLGLVLRKSGFQGPMVWRLKTDTFMPVVPSPP